MVKYEIIMQDQWTTPYGGYFDYLGLASKLYLD